MLIWGVFITLLALPGMFAGRRGIRWNGRVTRLWGAGVARIMNMKIDCTGKITDDFLHGILISNHQSYLDILVASSVFPVRFLPKAEIRFVPVAGWFIALNRPIWVNRKNPASSAGVAEETARSLAEGLPILAYPEGTTSDGTGLLPFKSTVFEAAAKSGHPVCPILIQYGATANGAPVPWFGDTPFLSHAWRILGQPGFGVKLALLEPIHPLPGEHRKDLSNRVRQIMLDHYRSM